MKAAAKFLRLAVILFSLSAAGFLWWFLDRFGNQEYEWNQRLTLHLMTPDGPAEFSSVTGIHCQAGYALDIGGTKVTCRETGEAIVAQLGERYLFVLLNGVALGYRGTFRALLEDGDDYRGYWKRITHSEGRSFDVTRTAWPRLVTFADIRDPKSIEAVKPDDLSTTFGPGYALTRVTVRVTREPVTTGEVEKALRWLHDAWPNQLDGQRYETVRASNRFANSISTGDFSTKVGQ